MRRVLTATQITAADAAIGWRAQLARWSSWNVSISLSIHPRLSAASTQKREAGGLPGRDSHRDDLWPRCIQDLNNVIVSVFEMSTDPPL